jgi:hypothetical protein
MPSSIRTACATASLLAVAATANAKVLTVEYKGVVVDSTSRVEIVGTYSFNSEAVPTVISPNVVSYPVLSHTFTLSKDAGGGTPFIVTNSNITVSNDVPILGSSSVTDRYIVDGLTDGLFDSVKISRVEVSFITIGNPNLSLANTDLPLEDADLRFDLTDGSVAVDFGDVAMIGTVTSFQFLDEAPQTVKCEGFFEPFDVAIGLPRKSNRVIPLRISLSDHGGVKLGAEDVAAPIINLRHAAGVFGDDLSELVDSAGRATEGNAFVWDPATGLWKYNLGTKPFSQPGTYQVDVTNGDDSYLVSPTCSGIFVRK